MQVWYGIEGQYVDVSHTYDGLRAVYVPPFDFARARLYGMDPVPGVLKHVLVRLPDATAPVVVPHGVPFKSGAHGEPLTTDETDDVLSIIHRCVLFSTTSGRGSMTEEYPEQALIAKFVPPSATVLEIGGNAGRSTCVLGSILTDSSRHVVFECDPASVCDLRKNVAANGFQTHIIPAALSRVPLEQQGWTTRPMANPAPSAGWVAVPTVTLAQIQERFAHLRFDTIVADCEGALYYICVEEPQLFENVHTVVVENDYVHEGHKEFVDEAMRRCGLVSVYSRAGGFGLHKSVFYEVWRKCGTQCTGAP